MKQFNRSEKVTLGITILLVLIGGLKGFSYGIRHAALYSGMASSYTQYMVISIISGLVYTMLWALVVTFIIYLTLKLVEKSIQL